MTLRFIQPIWQINGSVALPAQQSSSDVFDRLAHLFRQPGTTQQRLADTLSFNKKDPAAQDKMATFESGVLTVEQAATGSVLRYRLVSKTLLMCFLAPLVFLLLAQATTLLVSMEPKPDAAAAKPAQSKAADLPMNPVDKFLGAPAPEKPKDGEDKPGRGGRKPTATAGYVFAGIFALLYLIGRFLEARLVNRLFRKTLLDTESPASAAAA